MCALFQSLSDPLSLHAPYFTVPASLKNVTQSSAERRLRMQTRPSGLFVCFPLASKLESGIGTRSSAPSFLSGFDIPTSAMTTIALQRCRRFSVFASIESPLVSPFFPDTVGAVYVQIALVWLIEWHCHTYQMERYLRLVVPIFAQHRYSDAVTFVAMA